MLDLDQLEPGDRVVLRHRLVTSDDGSAGPASSDALGEILQVTAVDVTVLTRRGPVTVQRGAITHAKRVPPPPARRRPATGG